MQTAHTKLISRSYTGILTLDDAKDHLRLPVSLTDQDTLIESCIMAAVATAEARTEHIYGQTIYQIRVASEAADLVMPYPDFVQVNKVESIDTAGAVTTLFQKNTSPTPNVGTLSDFVTVDAWVEPAELSILEDNLPESSQYLVLTLQFGGGQIPFHVMQGIKMMLSHFYDNPREVEVGRTANQVPMGAETFFAMERFYRL